MNRIDCACIAKIVSESVELRASAKGVLWAGFSAVVGNGDDASWLRVSIFGDVARKLAGNITRGDKLYLEGQLTLSRYLKDGEERVNLQVAASKCEPLGIGRNRPKRERQGSPENNAGALPRSCLSA
jgi:single-stranded DNA-binding protein